MIGPPLQISARQETDLKGGKDPGELHQKDVASPKGNLPIPPHQSVPSINGSHLSLPLIGVPLADMPPSGVSV